MGGKVVEWLEGWEVWVRTWCEDMRKSMLVYDRYFDST